MTRIIDISVPLQSQMPVWPGSVGFQLLPTMRLDAGDIANVSQLITDIHVGTHVDAPWHFLTEGNTVEHLALDDLIGPAAVAYLPDISSVTAKDLAALDLPKNIKRLLLHTRNSKLWADGVTEFQEDFVALTADAAQWVVDRGIRLIGVDYLSVQRYRDSPLIHEILLKAGVVILEGLNLTNIQAGVYQLICLPLKLVDADGAPARAVLIEEEE
ncbi:cyclase family protein [Okeania sp. SIO2B3]|uniref:cyclase family protein n=1 Tax=Okeania sp. SIO2B3 TaxID=2607784 RepID=UPI0013C2516F|nr:cyclase family protein [Okeania sp. SIO2B3]NET41049.1 cyclase family protein [Okeania sp. SIO2B3]